MIRFEYKVIPAPARGLKGKGVKGPDGRFANALENVMNDMGAEGWDYQRAETLPSEERAGLTGKNTVFRNVLVFRRALKDDAPEIETKLLDAPTPENDPDKPTVDLVSEDAPETDQNEDASSEHTEENKD